MFSRPQMTATISSALTGKDQKIKRSDRKDQKIKDQRSKNKDQRSLGWLLEA
jgi:hypothetical protein